MKNKIKSLASNPFVQGSFLLTISNLIISTLNYFFNFLTGRALGPTGYGEITAFFSYSAIFSIPFTIVSSLIIQKIGSNDTNHYAFAKALELWFINKIKKWWFLSVLLIAIAPFMPRITNVAPVTGYLIIVAAIFAPFSVFYSSALQGLKLFLVFAVINIISAFIKFIGAVLVTFNIDGFITILSCLMISIIFNLVAVILSFRKYVKSPIPRRKIERRLTEAIFNRYFFLTSISVFSIVLLSNLDIIFVKKFFLPGEAGYFSAWSLFAKIIFYLVGPFVSLSFIFFSSKKNAGEQDRILIGTLLVLVVIGISCFFLYTFFPRVVEIIFGNKFKYIMPFLPLSALFGIFYSAINLFNNYFLAKKSLLTLILPLSFPIYIYILFTYRGNLVKVMNIDIFFALSVSVIYLGAYIFQKKFNRLFIISS